MLECLLAPLLEASRPHFDLSKTRLETLAVLLVGLANGRTVNLSHPLWMSSRSLRPMGNHSVQKLSLSGSERVNDFETVALGL